MQSTGAPCCLRPTETSLGYTAALGPGRLHLAGYTWPATLAAGPTCPPPDDRIHGSGYPISRQPDSDRIRKRSKERAIVRAHNRPFHISLVSTLHGGQPAPNESHWCALRVAAREEGPEIPLRERVGWCDPEPGCLGAGTEPAVPCGEYQPGLADSEGAGQVDGVGAAQGMAGSQLAGALLDGAGEFDGAGCGPVLLPGALRDGLAWLVEIVVAAGGGESGPDLGIGDSAGDGCIAPIP